MKTTILLVYEDLIRSEFLVHLLSDEKYLLTTASNGREALHKAHTESPDVIIVDADLPNVGAAKACNILKSNELTAHIPVVFMAESGDTEEEKKTFEAGACDYITRQQHADILKARILAAIATKRLLSGLMEESEQLRRSVYVDELTGLRNREYLVHRAEEEMARAKRYGANLSCVMIGVDDYDHLRTTYGREHSRAVLKQLTDILKTSSRLSDIIVFLGGERFVILLPGAMAYDAMIYAEKIRMKVEREVFAGPSARKTITVSMGVVSFDPDSSDDSHRLVQKAERALERSVRLGGNKVSSYSQVVEP